MHWAAKYGSLDVVKCLLRLGINYELVDIDGKKALDLSRQYNHKDVEIVVSGHHANMLKRWKQLGH